MFLDFPSEQLAEIRGPRLLLSRTGAQTDQREALATRAEQETSCPEAVRGGGPETSASRDCPRRRSARRKPVTVSHLDSGPAESSAQSIPDETVATSARHS